MPFTMKGRLPIVVFAGASCLALFACGERRESPPAADLVFLGGHIVTMADDAGPVGAVAVSGGKIVFAGPEAEARKQIGERTEVVDLAGGMLLPGFQDAHVHPLSGGVELGDCDLNPAKSRDEVLAKLGECAAADPDAPWLRGGGFQLPMFPGGNPRADLLDAIEAGRPAFVTSADGHSAWVNSAALRLAGISAATPDPEAGRIERDPATGEPSGTLRETAMELVSVHLPARTAEELETGLRRGLEMAAHFGITAFQEASADREMVAAYGALARRGELTARASISLWVDPKKGPEQIPELAALRREFETERLRVGTVKLFLDGVIEGKTAALLAPYVGSRDFAGELNFAPDALAGLVTALDAEGFQIHMHAIGDRAIRVGLDALEAARDGNGLRDSRHHLAHVQLFDPLDIPRFRELDVTANFQPLWAYADTYITELTEPVLGPERSRWLYPIGSVVASGADIAFGSDWSVSSMNPLLGIEVGVTRRDPESGPGPAWIPEERVDLATMLRGYTLGSARLNFLDHETGTLEVGKSADLVVLERDLFAIPVHEIGETAVVMTVLGGEIVYRRP